MTDAKLVPIHAGALQETKHCWLPFLESVARQTKDDLNALVARVESHEVHIMIVWDAASDMPLALFGVRVFLCGSMRVAEGVWLTGAARHLWEHLWSECEAYMKSPDGMNCQRSRMIPRPGWKPQLKKAGYRLTHIVMEKDL